MVKETSHPPRHHREEESQAGASLALLLGKHIAGGTRSATFHLNPGGMTTRDGALPT